MRENKVLHHFPQEDKGESKNNTGLLLFETASKWIFRGKIKITKQIENFLSKTENCNRKVLSGDFLLGSFHTVNTLPLTAISQRNPELFVIHLVLWLLSKVGQLCYCHLMRKPYTFAF